MRSRKRQVFLEKVLICFLAFFIAAGLSIGLGDNYAEAQTQEEGADLSVTQKYYKSIRIEYGDTLWDIAKQYMDGHYESIYEYIDEITEINGLVSDNIHEGCYLTIVYYDKG